jgi:hypothetical protein
MDTSHSPFLSILILVTTIVQAAGIIYILKSNRRAKKLKKKIAQQDEDLKLAAANHKRALAVLTVCGYIYKAIGDALSHYGTRLQVHLDEEIKEEPEGSSTKFFDERGVTIHATYCRNLHYRIMGTTPTTREEAMESTPLAEVSLKGQDLSFLLEVKAAMDSRGPQEFILLIDHPDFDPRT